MLLIFHEFRIQNHVIRLTDLEDAGKVLGEKTGGEPLIHTVINLDGLSDILRLQSIHDWGESLSNNNWRVVTQTSDYSRFHVESLSLNNLNLTAREGFIR
jgi:hypothetical protein